MKIEYLKENEISILEAHSIKNPKYTTLFCNLSAFPEVEKIVLMNCKKDPKLVKTDEGWEVLL